MEPVSLIISALSAAAGELGKEAVIDSYNELKQIIVKRFLKEKNDAGKIAVEKFESKPDVWKEALKDALLESQADKDDAIIEIAKKLMNLIVSAQNPMSNIDSNTGNVIVQNFHISGTENNKTAPISNLENHLDKETSRTETEKLSEEISAGQEQSAIHKVSKKIRIGCSVILAILCFLIAALFIFVDTPTHISSISNFSFTSDEAVVSKKNEKIPFEPSIVKKPDSAEQAMDIDALIAQAKAKKIREQQLEQQRQKEFKQRQQKLEQELGKYDELLKTTGSSFNEQAWNIICNRFPKLIEGLKPGDTIELRVRAGLTIEPGDIWIEPITGMEFVWIPAGCFQMGSNSKEAYSNENYVHEVCVDGFWMAKHEVTNKQYKKYKPNHNSKDYEGIDLNGDNQPAVYVSWNDAKEFAKWLSQQSKKNFSLPTEAQWEYAARAGTETERFWGNNADEACKYANVRDETLKNKWDWKSIHNCNDGYVCTAPVGSFKANDFGLYDMLGNVWEWCEDVYDKDAYKKHERNNPVMSSGSTYRVVRGGGWIDLPGDLRTANRFRGSAVVRGDSLGFRLCLSPVRLSGRQ